MSKFKVGDRVRRINTDWDLMGVCVGDIGTVESSDTISAKVKFDRGFSMTSLAENLELLSSPEEKEEGLVEGMAVDLEDRDEMFAAIKSEAKRLGVPMFSMTEEATECCGVDACLTYSDGELIRCSGKDKALIEDFDFIRRLRITAKELASRPKPIKIGEWEVKFNKDSITVGCTTIPNETVLSIAERIKGK